MDIKNWTFIYTCENIQEDGDACAIIEKNVTVLQFIQSAAVVMYENGQLDVVPIYDLRKV